MSTSLNLLDALIDEVSFMKIQKQTAFISGHLDLDKSQFELYYTPKIRAAMARNVSNFVVGDAVGADSMAQQFLAKEKQNVTIYHMFETPRCNYGHFMTKGGFKSETRRDAAMTQNSDFDIAWIRSVAESKKIYGAKYNPKRISGTQKNIVRRASLLQATNEK